MHPQRKSPHLIWSLHLHPSSPRTSDTFRHPSNLHQLMRTNLVYLPPRPKPGSFASQRPCCKTCPIHPSSLSFTSPVINLTYPIHTHSTSSTSSLAPSAILSLWERLKTICPLEWISNRSFVFLKNRDCIINFEILPADHLTKKVSLNLVEGSRLASTRILNQCQTVMGWHWEKFLESIPHIFK